MDTDKRKEQHLAEARKAEDLAAKASSPAVRDHWLKIAEGYRYLANAAGKHS